MAFSTNIAPAAAGFGNEAVIVAVSPDNRIFHSWWELGKNGPGWQEIEGNGRTDTTPAVSMYFRNEEDTVASGIVSVIKGIGTDGNIYMNVGGLNGDPQFSQWQLFTDVKQDTFLQTNVGPAATVCYNTDIIDTTTILVAASTDGRIFYNDGYNFYEESFRWNFNRNWVELEGSVRTDATPAAALVGGKNPYLFAVVKGLDGQLYLNQGDLGKPFVGWLPMGFSTHVAPGATSSGNTSVVVATSTDGRIFYNWWPLGQGGQWRELEGNGRTDAAPAAALVANTYLFVIVKGLDGHLYLNQGELGKPFIGWGQI